MKAPPPDGSRKAQWQDLGPRSTETQPPPDHFRRADGSFLRETEIIAVARGVTPQMVNEGTFRLRRFA